MAVHFRSLRKSLGVLIYPVTASIALAILVSAAGAAYAQTPDSIWKESLDNIEGSGLGVPIEQVFEEIFKQEGPSFKDIVQGILTGKGVKLKDCLKLLLGQALGNISGYAKILGQIILIGVTISCLNILGQTMAPDGSSRIAQTSAHMVLVLVAVLSFRDVLNVSVEAVNGLRTAFFAFIPVVTGMVLASGAPVTAGVLYPTVFGMGTFVSVFILDVAFPLIFTSIAIDLAGNLGGGERVSGVADVLRQTAFVGMGLLLSAFVGVVAGERAAAGVADGIALRTAKYMSSTFVPVAGKMVGDTMDMFFHSLFALRSAIGLAGSIALIGIVLSPLVKVFSCFVAWRIALALLGPTCGPQVKRLLQAMAGGVGLLAVVLFATSFIFIICLSLVAQAAKAL
jgi:stage III sporulation protein AE